jgi:hypothetical protein
MKSPAPGPDRPARAAGALTRRRRDVTTAHGPAPFILAVVLALCVPVLGGEPVADSKETVTPSSTTGSILSGDLGVSAMNQFNSRGLVLENKGVVWQPYADLFVKLAEPKEFVDRVSLQLGIWNDINPAGPIAAPTARDKAWTEFYWQAGFLVKFAGRFSLSSVWRQFSTPSDAYKWGRSLINVLSYDDSGLLAPNFSFNPQVTVLYELPAPGHHGLRGHSWYFAPGISPTYKFTKDGRCLFALSLPMLTGLGSGFYAGDTFGYFSVGPQLSVPLGFLPEKLGKWDYTAGYKYYRLGATTEAFAADHRFSQNLFYTSLELKF